MDNYGTTSSKSEQHTDDDDCFWVMSSLLSYFVSMSRAEIRDVVETQLREVEHNLKVVCLRLRQLLDDGSREDKED